MDIQEVKVAAIDLSFERFRFVDPHADTQMIASMKTFGQLSPVFAGRLEKKVLLVDGYKRLRAAKALSRETLQVHMVERSVTVLKALALTANQEQSPCRELEEALLVQSLYRDDGLQQNEIAALCNRHKSWVCRRIALVERISNDVQEQLRLGLITISVARELLRLPRGNQLDVLQSLLDNHLGSRQCRQIVDAYLSNPQWKHKTILQNPLQFVTAQQWSIDLGCFTPLTHALLRCSNKLAVMIQEKGLGSLHEEQRQQMHKTLQKVGIQCSSILDMIETRDTVQ